MPTEQLIPRGQLLKRMNISDSTERRKRQCGENWPAHVMVGNRILYSESSIKNWVAAQESLAAVTGAGDGTGGHLGPGGEIIANSAEVGRR